MTTDHQTSAPNHHAHYPGFAGVSGVLAALSMIGRKGDARLVAELSGVRPADTVVDIGCGPGTAVRHAARLGATAIGVDPAPVMLRIARLVPAASAGGRARFALGSAEDVPLPDDSASVAWTIASVHHWKDLDAALREAQRVVRAGGRFVAVERRTQPDATGHASHGWTDEQADAFVQRCLDHGFTDAKIDQHTTGRRTVISVTVTVA